MPNIVILISKSVHGCLVLSLLHILCVTYHSCSQCHMKYRFYSCCRLQVPLNCSRSNTIHHAEPGIRAGVRVLIIDLLQKFLVPRSCYKILKLLSLKCVSNRKCYFFRMLSGTLMGPWDSIGTRLYVFFVLDRSESVQGVNAVR